MPTLPMSKGTHEFLARSAQNSFAERQNDLLENDDAFVICDCFGGGQPWPLDVFSEQTGAPGLKLVDARIPVRGHHRTSLVLYKMLRHDFEFLVAQVFHR